MRRRDGTGPSQVCLDADVRAKLPVMPELKAIGRPVPRGPSTVMSLDLIWTLTVHKSACVAGSVIMHSLRWT